MALNVKKAENRRNNADREIEKMNMAELKENSVTAMIQTLDADADQPQPKKEEQAAPAQKRRSTTGKKERKDNGLGLNQDGTYRQSNAGRKSIDKTSKKVQLVLTLTPQTVEKLKSQAEGKLRSAPNYVSEYVERHLEDILNSF